MSDINSYRAIAISPALSKLFEVTLESYIKTDSDIENHQFGFKAGHSTALCTSILKQTVGYYISRGSCVFACFVDFHKAFDKVNYWKLFLKLGVATVWIIKLCQWRSQDFEVGGTDGLVGLSLIHI